MRSLLVEFHRFGELDTGILRKGDRYIIAAATRPRVEFPISVDHRDVLHRLQSLRYPPANAAVPEQALNEIGKIVSDILGIDDLIKDEKTPLQLDLVVNAAELATLPFEAVLDAQGAPILLRKDRPVELTRRVRQQFAETAVAWPSRPRVLYAWACPFTVAATVPFKEHEQALREALAPWDPPDESGASSGVLTVLPKASIEGIHRVCEAARSNKNPFSHVHILAHGYPTGEGFERRFGLALHMDGFDDMLDAVDPEALCKALEPLNGFPVIVTLAACDAANEANPVIPERSVAHRLHVSGFPVVIASQLPLTMEGSTVLVQSFYGALLSGWDVRLALHNARIALSECEAAGHDWASLVAYIRLPEGYADHLRGMRLQSELSSLKAIQSRSDRLIATEAGTAEKFDRLIGLLSSRLAALEAFLTDPDYPSRSAELDENLGLLGSAEKRLAELRFERDRLKFTEQSRAAVLGGLNRSREWYWKSFQRNLSSHWAGTQALSLETILTGKIQEPEYWHTAVLAAKLDLNQSKDKVWALGSLAELYLIAPAAGMPDRSSDSAALIEQMKALVTGADRFPLESTRRQLMRYVLWWNVANGFFPNGQDLAATAQRLADILRP